jgi:hypothetical protein
MSRLGARIRRLEERLGPCGLCADWTPRLEWREVSDARPHSSEGDRTCPACGRLDELIVYLAYDPRAGRDDDAGRIEERP